MKNFIAHRGNDNHKYKENTLDAILESLSKDYILGVEFDVRITKDKKIVVTHNNSISKASDGWGLVKHMTLRKLRKYNFGTKKHPAKIATLEEVLKKIYCDKKIVIDIKEESDNFKQIACKIYKIIKKYSYLNLYLCSFNHKLIEYFNKKHPNLKLGVNLLFANNIDKHENYCDFYLINYLSYENNSNKEIMLWTVNSDKVYNEIKNKLTKNISIITDKAYTLMQK